jgi:16S rRNA processing protein RimM
VTEEPDFVVIGRVRGAHGIGGEVRLESVSDVPERFAGLKRALLKRSGEIEEIGVASVRTKGAEVLLKFDGIDDRTAAESLAGAELGVRRQEVWPLASDTYYVFQIMGSRVVGDGGREIGIVEDVLKMPANDVLVVRTAKGQALVPVTRNVVRRIDAAAKLVEIEELEGLLD